MIEVIDGGYVDDDLMPMLLRDDENYCPAPGSISSRYPTWISLPRSYSCVAPACSKVSETGPGSSGTSKSPIPVEMSFASSPACLGGGVPW